MKNFFIVFFFLFYYGSNAQIKQEKIIIIIRPYFYWNSKETPECIFNNRDTIKIKSKSCILKNIDSDSLILEVPHLIFNRKIIPFHFSIKKDTTYFVFKYRWMSWKPILKEVSGKYLEKLKKRKYVRGKLEYTGLGK